MKRSGRSTIALATQITGGGHMADKQPAPWRKKDPCYTFQHWKFNKKPQLVPLADGTNDTEPMNPEIDRNPFNLPYTPPMKRPWLIVRQVRPPHTGWLPGFANKQGVWRLAPPDYIF